MYIGHCSVQLYLLEHGTDFVCVDKPTSVLIGPLHLSVNEALQTCSSFLANRASTPQRTPGWSCWRK